jgi:hypothetical protein
LIGGGVGGGQLLVVSGGVVNQEHAWWHAGAVCQGDALAQAQLAPVVEPGALNW